MIKYFPKVQAITTIVAFVVLAVLLSLIYFFAPQDFFWYLIGPIICIFLATLVSRNVGNRLLGVETDKVFKVLLEDCDPCSFLEISDPVVKRIKDPKGVWEASLLSCRSLALFDIGKREEAEKVFYEFADTKNTDLKPIIKGRIAMYAYAPALDLFGVQGAQKSLAIARSYLSDSLISRILPGFKAWADKQQEVVSTLMSRDCENIITLMKSSYTQSSYAMFNRVRNARAGAKAAQECNDIYSEIEFLGFIVQNGNKLRAVDEARTRLWELKSLSRQASSSDVSSA